jgi:hypothetical protein
MTMQKVPLAIIIALATTGVFLTVFTAGLLTDSETVASVGSITAVNVGVYSDSGCAQVCTSVDWGALAPSSAATRTIYVKNTGTVPVTLSMAPSGWAPSNANAYLTLSWNQAGSVLNPGASVAATLT